MEYTAVIRTLGKAGDKYQQLLDSLIHQTCPPKEILVYIAEGYSLPKETVGVEKYIYVKKGMMAQRALPYTEVTTDFMLFLDDDLSLAEDTVECLYTLLSKNKADVISPDIFPNSQRKILPELLMTVSGRMRARRGDKYWGYKVMRSAGYSYNKCPLADTLESQTNAGACFLCRKAQFLSIHLEDETWIDSVAYAIGDDQLIFYKMYRFGLKILTWYNHRVQHLDAGQNLSPDKERTLIYGDFRFKTIFWHRFIYKPDKSMLGRLLSMLAIGYAFAFGLAISLLKFQFNIFQIKRRAIQDGIKFIKSNEYKKLPAI